MANLDAIEAAFIKNLNAKLKGLGGEVTVIWKNGRIVKYAIKSEDSGEVVYKGSTLDNPNIESELKD